MEPSSPLSLFEAVFKVIEERLPYGRHLVTLVSVLMLAVLIVFCVGYLFEALIAPANWIALSISTRSLASVPNLPAKHALVFWLLIVGISLYAGGLSLRFWKTTRGMRKTTAQLNQISQKLNEDVRVLNDAIAKARQAAAAKTQVQSDTTMTP